MDQATAEGKGSGTTRGNGNVWITSRPVRYDVKPLHWSRDSSGGVETHRGP